MGLIRDIDRLTPAAKKALTAAITDLEAKAIRFWINETLRTASVQEAYYAQGRKPLNEVNTLRQIAGLWSINSDENKRTITNTLKSVHLLGNAVDICPANASGAPWWNAPIAEWQKIADVMKAHGFEWGGDWKDFKDTPHYQLKE